MKRIVAATLFAMLAAVPVAAVAQDVDDWEHQEDPAQGVSLAAVRYDGGAAIVVQCRAGALTVVMAGLPALDGDLILEASRVDGRTDVQTWSPGGGPGAFRSDVPARDARFMRGGGAYSVRTVDGASEALRTQFDLPTQSTNLDRVLAACGWTLTDERDLLRRAGSAVSFTDPDAPQARTLVPRRAPSRSVTGRGRRPPPPPPRAPRILPAEQQISCIVRSLRLTDCRPDHAAPESARPPGAPDPAEDVRRLEGSQVWSTDAAAVEGTVLYVHGPRLVRVVEYITR